MECTPVAGAAFGRTVVVRTRRGQHTSQAGGAMTVRESGESRGNVLDSVTIAAELEALGALHAANPRELRTAVAQRLKLAHAAARARAE